MQMRHLPDVSEGYSAVSVGAGWAKYLSDHNLGVGAFLTFEVVDARRLVVASHIRFAPEDSEEPQQPDVDSGAVRDYRPCEPAEAQDTHRHATIVHPDVRSDEALQFRKILRKTHLKKHNSSRIVSDYHPRWSTHLQPYSQFRAARQRGVFADPWNLGECTSYNLRGAVLGVGAGCTNQVLAHSRQGSVRWRVVHSTWRSVRM